MSTGTQTLEELDGAGKLLDGARFELMPFESFPAPSSSSSVRVSVDISCPR